MQETVRSGYFASRSLRNSFALVSGAILGELSFIPLETTASSVPSLRPPHFSEPRSSERKFYPQPFRRSIPNPTEESPTSRLQRLRAMAIQLLETRKGHC